MLVNYCNADCQKNNWLKHKQACKLRAAELHDEALFKDPPAKEECPICFLPMPRKIISCVSLPPATIMSIPIIDFAIANLGLGPNGREELVNMSTEVYYSCCGKYICGGCVHSFESSGNDRKCPFCNSDQDNKTDEERVEDIMKRVESNDPTSICLLAQHYHHGTAGLQQNHSKAVELYARAADLGSSKAHYNLGAYYHERGYSKKEKFHYEAAAMAGDEVARFNLGCTEKQSGNLERAVKHCMIAASAGQHTSMHNLRTLFEQGLVSRDSIDLTLTAYNNSCAAMRSEARDAFIRMTIDRTE